jgi:hypothetical protein
LIIRNVLNWDWLWPIDLWKSHIIRFRLRDSSYYYLVHLVKYSDLIQRYEVCSYMFCHGQYLYTISSILKNMVTIIHFLIILDLIFLHYIPVLYMIFWHKSKLIYLNLFSEVMIVIVASSM